MKNEPPPALIPALNKMNVGDLDGARAALGVALTREPASAILLEFGAYLAARTGNDVDVADFSRRLLDIDAGHVVARVNLATALLTMGREDEAGVVVSGQPDVRLRRLNGHLLERGRHFEAAIREYEAVVEASPDDFTSWNNLGNARGANGDPEGAAIALKKAIAIRPDLIPIYLNLAEALTLSEQFTERRDIMREAARRASDRADVLLELGLAEAGMRSFPEAEAALREAIRLTDGFSPAYIELGIVLENLNRIADLRTLLADADAKGIVADELSFLKAWLLRRESRFEEALPLAEAAPETLHILRRAHLIGDIRDRLGDAAGAFSAFHTMNEAARSLLRPTGRPSFTEEVVSNTALLTPEKIAAWQPLQVVSEPASPIFIVGFPRSGTTLIDTMLMNVPNLHILEEQPIFSEVTKLIGSDEGNLANLDEVDARRMRRNYFDEVYKAHPHAIDRIIVDKHPLRMTRVATIHRLFPDARIVLVERHPCDVVLSCYMANFQLNHGMRAFVDLEATAKLYDAAFNAWSRATYLLPVEIHTLRYERLITNAEREMRQLLSNLGIAWSANVLDNSASARRRGPVRTASYSQVHEPIYQRAVNRWERYRKQMAQVIPILTPWVEKMGYHL